MEYGKKKIKTAKIIFNRLNTDPSSVVFAEELLDEKLLIKFKKSKYVEGKNNFKLVNLNNTNVIFESENLKKQIMLKQEKLITLH